jgi:hypothetical protein
MLLSRDVVELSGSAPGGTTRSRTTSPWGGSWLPTGSCRSLCRGSTCPPSRAPMLGREVREATIGSRSSVIFRGGLGELRSLLVRELLGRQRRRGGGPRRRGSPRASAWRSGVPYHRPAEVLVPDAQGRILGYRVSRRASTLAKVWPGHGAGACGRSWPSRARQGRGSPLQSRGRRGERFSSAKVSRRSRWL